jgi:hypothetical protein
MNKRNHVTIQVLKSQMQMNHKTRRVLSSIALAAIVLSSHSTVSAAETPPKKEAVKSVRLVLPGDASPVVKNIGAVFTRQVQQRCEAKVITTGDAPLTVELAVEKGLGAEGYRIEDRKDGGVRIAGNDERGVLYGVGKFLRTSRYEKGGFTPGSWRGTSVPEKAVRGIYFATHFHNYYHVAPIEEVERYVEDLGLWGFNVVMVYYDLHHFKSFDAPESQAFLQRERALLNTARRIGLDTALVIAANEGYAGDPKELRADMRGVMGGQFDTNLCPSKPEGRKLIVANFTQLFDAFADLQPRHLVIWPYDVGGCACEKCRPWATNGFLGVSEPLARLAKSKFPGAQITLATWGMKDDEIAALYKAFPTRPDWVDYFMTAQTFIPVIPEIPLEKGVPGGVAALNFPDLCTCARNPVGGSGYLGFPNAFQQRWKKGAAIFAGGFPYSEGIWEDLSKVHYAQLYWQADRSAEEILKEYFAFEFSPNDAEELLKVSEIFERNNKQAEIGADADQAWEILQRVDARLTPQARTAWRWRVFYLRGMMDHELRLTKGKLEGPVIKDIFEELKRLYYYQPGKTEWMLRMPEVPLQRSVK